MAAQDDLDLSRLDARGAREYVLAFIKTLKETEHRRGALEGELRVWTERAALARSHGREDLGAAADARAASLRQQLAGVQGEEEHLKGQVSALKERLKLKLHGEIERSVDSEKLEADLEMLVGGDAALESKLESARAESEADDLRKRPRE